ncbi:MAG: hypothetical protein AB7V77_03640 [Candidatus Woesearchaeota archaeon]
MKKIMLLLILVLLLFSSCLKETTTEIITKEISTYSCPRGEIDCNYPGKCYLYTDENKDNICDNSEKT